MATTVDQRVVEMRFDNAQFERNVQQSMNTLNQLDKSIDALEGTQGLSALSITMNQVSRGFDALGSIGFSVFQRLTNSVIDLGARMVSSLLTPINQMASGGWARAMNIEQAKFQFEGLGMDIEGAMESANDAVADTAYSLDAAAKVAGMLGTTGMQAGKEMTKALTAVSGVAAQTQGSYEDIGNIFTDIAAAGRVTGDSLTRLSYRGINAAQVLGDALGKTSADVRKMASKGQISFKQFYDAMYAAFGEHAYKANETYAGSLANVNSALNKIGADFQQYKIQNMVKVFNSLRKAINLLRVELTPASKVYGAFQEMATSAVSKFIDDHAADAAKALGIALEGLANIFDKLLYIAKLVSVSFKDIFPESLSFKLSDIAEKFRTFTEGLEITEEMARKIVMTFNGIFSLFGIFKLLIEAVVKSIFPTADGFNSLADAVLTFTGYLGYAITALYKWLKENNVLLNIAQGIKLAFTVIISVVMLLIDKIYELYKAISENETVIAIFGFLKTAAVTAFGYIASAVKTVIGLFRSFKNETASIATETASGVGTVIDWFSDIGKRLKTAIGEINKTKAGMFIFIGFIAALATALVVAAVRLSNGVKSIGGAFKRLTGWIGGMQSSINSMIKASKVNRAIRNFIVTLGLFVLLARELRKLAELDVENIWSAAGALFLILNIVTGIGIAINKTFQGSILKETNQQFDTVGRFITRLAMLVGSVSTGLRFAAGADPDALHAAGVSIAASLAAIALVLASVSLITKYEVNPSQLNSLSIMVVALGGAILAIGGALSLATSGVLSWKQIAASGGAIILTLTALGGIITALNAINIESKTVGKVGSLLLLTLSLIPIGIALGMVAKHNWKDWQSILAGGGALTGCLIALSGIMFIISQAASEVNPAKLLASSASMLVMTLSLIPVAMALNKLKTYDWDSMWQTLILISGVMTVAGGLMVALGEFATSSAYAILAIGIAATAYLTFGAALMFAGKGVMYFADAFSVMTKEVDFVAVARGLLLLEGALSKFTFGSLAAAGALSGTIILAGIGIEKFAVGLAKLSSIDLTNFSDGLTAILNGIAGHYEAFVAFSAELDVLSIGLAALAPPLQALSMPALAFAAAFVVASLGMLAFAGALRLATPALEAFQYLKWELISAGFALLADGIRQLAISSLALSLSSKGLGIAALALAGLALEALTFEYVVDVPKVAAEISMLGKACMYLGTQAVSMAAGALGIGVMAAAVWALGEVISTAATLMPQNVAKITNSLKNLSQAGYYAAAGFAKGVIVGLKDVVKSGVTMAAGFIDSVCQVLQIASPSAFMMTIGEFTGSGFIMGIANKMAEAEASGGSMAGAVIAGVTEQLPLFEQLGNTAASFFNNGLSAGVDYMLGTYAKAGNKTNMSERGFSSSGYVKETTLADRLIGKIKDFGKDVFNLDDALGQFSDIAGAGGAAGAADALGDSLEGAGGKAKKTKEEMDNLRKTIEGQINLFEEFNKETDLTADKLLENMKSQISGAAEWTNWIHQLGERGASAGLIKKLADMGQQNGYKYAKAFMDMSAEQLAQANVFYATSLAIPDNAMFAIQDSFAMAGEWAAAGFANGITPDAATQEVTLMGIRSLNALKDTLKEKSPSEETKAYGINFTKGFANGVIDRSPMELVFYNINHFGSEVFAKMQKALPIKDFKDVGKNIVLGIKNGVEDSAAQSSLFSSVISLCNKVKDAATSPKGFWERSPSRVFEEIGSYVSLGLAEGISKSANAPVNSILGVTDDVKAGMRTAIDAIKYAFDSDVDLTPTIRPVVDLTDVQTGIDSINDLMPSSRINVGSTSRYLPSDIATSGGNGDVVSAVNSLKEDVAYLGEAITNMQMVLDTGTMVGAMTPAIDQQLYTRQVYAGRGM